MSARPTPTPAQLSPTPPAPVPAAAKPTHRAALVVALTANALLLALLGLAVWAWRTHWAPPARTQTANTPAPSVQPNSSPAPSAPAPGPDLAPVELSPQRRQSIGVTTAVVERRAITDNLRLVGNVAVDERRQAYVQTRFAGWIRQVYVNANYQRVEAGQPLFTIYSPDLVTTEREYLLARQNAQLLASSPVPGVAAGARSLLAATLERLRQWALPAREIQRLERTGRVRRDIEVDSPAAGFITERNALPNMYVQPSTRLYTITDLSKVWVEAQAYQNDLGRLAVGDRATLTLDAYPGRTFAGRVDFIDPEVNASTRTARVRLVFANPGLLAPTRRRAERQRASAAADRSTAAARPSGGRLRREGAEPLLKPGMFVNVDLKIPLGSQIAVPASAVLQSGESQVAFLDRGDGYLAPRKITLGPPVGDRYIVLHGLRPGERIVTSANFLIDSESQLQAAVGGFQPPPPPPASAAAAAPAAYHLSLATQPAAPVQGANRFQVRLTGAHGAAIAGAQVAVHLVLPAMPAMGMAALQARYDLADVGGGVYAAPVQIPGAGSWQATVVARRNGAVIATRQFQLSVGGGK